MQVPHAFTTRLRSEKSTHVPVRSPSHEHTEPEAAHRRDETHTFPLPQSALELQVVGCAPETAQASPVTQTFEHTSPEQHAPFGHARQTFWVGHMPQSTFVVSQVATRVVVEDGHAASSPSQQGWSSGTHVAPQWCCPGEQSLLPLVPVGPQQNCPEHPRVVFKKQPVFGAQYELVLPVPSSQQTDDDGRQPVPQGAVPGAQRIAWRCGPGSGSFVGHPAHKTSATRASARMGKEYHPGARSTAGSVRIRVRGDDLHPVLAG